MTSASSNRPTGASRVPVIGKALMTPTAVVNAAFDDAGVDPANVIVFGHAAEHLNDSKAMTLPRGNEIHPPNLGDLEEAVHSEDAQRLLRVLIWEAPPIVQAALLRHELEHCGQLETHKWAYVLHCNAEEMWSDLIGDLADRNIIYQHIPMEHDANAASSRFVRRHFGDDAVDRFVDTDTRPLLCGTTHTPDLSTVIQRMEHFIAEEVKPLCEKFRAAVEQGLPLDPFRTV
jgi:hypothetical protein